MTGILHVVREFKKIPVKNTIVREGLEAEVQETVEVWQLPLVLFHVSDQLQNFMFDQRIWSDINHCPLFIIL